ncbi:MAG: LuxR C-terminal-related transcriptional regulator [Aeromicrobium sp.]|uniref:LuxR C-terminal-related transcriptional regulator n=1 Tax=Aeromicrobium sp. TaxID=1871063 RepID=UPI003C4C6B33
MTTSGAHDDALRSLEVVLADMNHADFSTAVRLAAAIHAHRGTLSRSAELFALVAPESLGQAAAEGAVALLGIGDADGAHRMLAASRLGAPTAWSAGWRLVTTGLEHSVVDDGVAGLAPLLQSVTALTPVGRDCVMLDSPAALAALMALHLGELDLAESVLGRAVAADLGGPRFRLRHQILLGWVAMARGDMDGASTALDEAGAPPSDDTRDTYLLHAVRVGIARRSSDTGALAEAWATARTAVAETSVDLFHLLALGELLVGAARLQDEHWLAPQLHQAKAVLDGLGQPALWSAAFHWYGVQAALASERPDVLIPHADAISEAARVSRHAQTLTSAGRTWLRVLKRDVDLSAVTEAVHGLGSIGLTWDASQLAAQAALHSSDRRVSLDLLTLARAAHSGHTATSASPSTHSRSSQLTDREWEIARLVVQGFGYREIGERLFISPRTVEHHIASVRRRLGAPNRAEMMETLRRLVEGSSTTEAQ